MNAGDSSDDESHCNRNPEGPAEEEERQEQGHYCGDCGEWQDDEAGWAARDDDEIWRGNGADGRWTGDEEEERRDDHGEDYSEDVEDDAWEEEDWEE
jgi:hypothetical protein